jgi:hypothetical protein
MVYADEVWDEAQQLLAHENYEGRAFGNWEYDWQAIGKIYAESRPVDTANLVLTQMREEAFLHRLERYTAVLNVALRIRPRAIWELIAPVFLKEAFLLYGHSELDIENELIRPLWIDENRVG